MSRRPQVSGAESPIDPKIAWLRDVGKTPRVKVRAGSIEKRLSLASHASSYSNVTVSARRAVCRRRSPTSRVVPFRSIWTSTSAIGFRFSFWTSAFGKFCCGEGLTYAVSGQVCDVGQAVEQPKGLQGGGVNADADAGIASLDPLKGGSRREGSIGDDAHWQPTPLARVPN